MDSGNLPTTKSPALATKESYINRKSSKKIQQASINDIATTPRKSKWASMGTVLSGNQKEIIEDTQEVSSPFDDQVEHQHRDISPVIRSKLSFSFNYNASSFAPIVKQTTLDYINFTSESRLPTGPHPVIKSPSQETISYNTEGATFAHIPKIRSPSQDAISFTEGEAFIASSFFNSEFQQKKELISTEVGMLKDLEMRDFTGIWSHCLSKIYYLMFLAYHKRENIYVKYFLIKVFSHGNSSI
jgi:hypothetical protein